MISLLQVNKYSPLFNSIRELTLYKDTRPMTQYTHLQRNELFNVGGLTTLTN